MLNLKVRILCEMTVNLLLGTEGLASFFLGSGFIFFFIWMFII